MSTDARIGSGLAVVAALFLLLFVASLNGPSFEEYCDRVGGTVVYDQTNGEARCR